VFFLKDCALNKLPWVPEEFFKGVGVTSLSVLPLQNQAIKESLWHPVYSKKMILIGLFLCLKFGPNLIFISIGITPTWLNHDGGLLADTYLDLISKNRCLLR